MATSPSHGDSNDTAPQVPRRPARCFFSICCLRWATFHHLCRINFPGFAMGLAMPWVCNGFAMGLPWVCHALAMRWPCVCHAFAMRFKLLCVCHAFAMRLPCVCHAFAMRLPCVWQCHVFPMRLPCGRLISRSMTLTTWYRSFSRIGVERARSLPAHLPPSAWGGPIPRAGARPRLRRGPLGR